MQLKDLKNNIIDYEQFMEILNTLLERKNKWPITEITTTETKFGYPIRAFEMGNGDNSIIISGGTHGSEIIAPEVVLTMMDRISSGYGKFRDFDLNKYKFIFVPMHNPEGYIISTSSARKLVPADMSNEEAIKKFQEYADNFGRDNRLRLENNKNQIPDLHEPKSYLKMIADLGGTYEAIGDQHKALRESVKHIMIDFLIKVRDKDGNVIEIPANHQAGAEIMWRANGSGVELMKNFPTYNGFIPGTPPFLKYGYANYNNIIDRVPGPIGAASINPDLFEYEPETKFLNELIMNERKNGRFIGYISYHAVMGKIQYIPEQVHGKDDNQYYLIDESLRDPEKMHQAQMVNTAIANVYNSITGYGYEDDAGAAQDEVDRATRGPGEILVELSQVGPNPVGPYTDPFNHMTVVAENVHAIIPTAEMMLKLKPFTNGNAYLSDIEDTVRGNNR